MRISMQSILLLRRWALQKFIPECLWPKTIFVHNTEIKIRNTPYTFGTRWLIKNGIYETEEIELILSILKPGMNVIEMGGSIGIVTAVTASEIGPKGNIISIEASKKLSEYSKSWLEKMGNVKIIHGYGFPIWEAPKIKITGFEEVTGNLGGTASFDISDSGDETGTSDEVFDIKRICSEFTFSPNTLIIDIEGSEILMANQPISLPPTVQYIVIEFHDWYYKNGKSDEEKINNSILADGFKLIRQQASVCLYERDLQTAIK